MIRERGYEDGPSDTIPGVTDICLPIFDHLGVVAALNVIYLQHRDVKTTIPQTRAALIRAAKAISRNLGGR